MPIDPRAQALLDLQAMTGFRGFDRMPVPEARSAMIARSADAPREAVARVEDRRTPGGVPVRLYWPEAGGAPRPALVYSHGGGWVLGNLETVDAGCRTLCNASGCVVASVDYRLAPEHRYPAAIDDAADAFAWVVTEAGRLGVDPARVAVGGDSAGGNLAIATCLRSRDCGGPRPAFQLLVYPVADARCATGSYHEFAEGFGLTRAAMQYYWRHYLGRPEDGDEPCASPLRADLTGLPAALVQTAECDPLRDDGEALAAALEGAGVPCTLRRYDGQIHGFFHMGHLMPRGRDALLDAADALRAALDATPAR